MSSELYHQIISQRGSLERLFERLPGFAGYGERAARRTADRLLRDHVASLLAQRISRLTQIERTLLDNGGMAYMSRTSSAKTKLQTYHDRVKAASLGYSSFFDAIKVDNEALDRLYAFDEMQLVYADRIAAALDTFEAAVASKAGIDEAIAALDALAVQANEAFSSRDSVLTNFETAK